MFTCQLTHWTGLAWPGLAWTGLGWAGLDWNNLDNYIKIYTGSSPARVPSIVTMLSPLLELASGDVTRGHQAKCKSHWPTLNVPCPVSHLHGYFSSFSKGFPPAPFHMETLKHIQHVQGNFHNDKVVETLRCVSNSPIFPNFIFWCCVRAFSPAVSYMHPFLGQMETFSFSFYQLLQRNIFPQCLLPLSPQSASSKYLLLVPLLSANSQRWLPAESSEAPAITSSNVNSTIDQCCCCSTAATSSFRRS